MTADVINLRPDAPYEAPTAPQPHVVRIVVSHEPPRATIGSVVLQIALGAVIGLALVALLIASNA